MSKKKIKILFLIDELLVGGTENQVVLLADNLPRNIFDPFIATLNENIHKSFNQISTPIINLRRSGLPLIKNISIAYKLWCFFEKENFHIIQTHFPEAEIYAALALKLCRHKPYSIGTRRNLYHWIHEEPLNYYLLRKVSRWVDCILVNSYKVKQLCQEKENIPSSKIKVIQNAVEVDKFNNIGLDEAKRIIGLEGIYPIIGVVANWRPIKGLVKFLKAASIVTKQIPESYFVLAGSGPQKNELQKLAHDLGIQHRVKFLENYPDIPTVIAAFDVAVQPSMSESFSNVLIEYMAAGKLIVATRVGDAERVIDHEKNGLLVRANDPQEMASAILSLCNDKKMATDMGRLAQNKVTANWSLDKIIKIYQQFYYNVIQNR